MPHLSNSLSYAPSARIAASASAVAREKVADLLRISRNDRCCAHDCGSTKVAEEAIFDTMTNRRWTLSKREIAFVQERNIGRAGVRRSIFRTCTMSAVVLGSASA